MDSRAAADTLRELAHTIVRRMPRGTLSLPGASTLSALERDGPQRITALAQREAVSQPAMTTLVHRLEAAGLVRKDPDPADARAMQISITDDGRATLDQRRRHNDHLITASLERLSDTERAAIEAALPAIRHLIEIHDHQH